MNYTDSYQRPLKKPSRSLLPLIFSLLICGLIVGYIYFALNRPLPLLQPATSSLNLQTGTGTSQLNWPTTGQAAVAVDNTTIVETHGAQSPQAIASAAKVITALVVLQKKPLQANQPGPTITMTDADAALYNNYVAQEGSVVPVAAGEQINQRQVLEAMMIPSANNLADSLAIWAFGSLDAYRTAATSYLNRHGLHDTHIGSDASGFSASTTSTAHDLAILGRMAMDNPALRPIVGMASTTDIPELASVSNVNTLLGSNNIIGIKTGNTNEAGGVYLSASTTQINGHSLTLITAFLGVPTLSEAMQASLPLISSAQANVVSNQVLAKHAVVGEYRQPWGGVLPAVAVTGLTSPAWRGSTLTAHVSLQPIGPNARAGQIVGSASTSPTSLGKPSHTNIILLQSPTTPIIWWRLLHPTD